MNNLCEFRVFHNRGRVLEKAAASHIEVKRNGASVFNCHVSCDFGFRVCICDLL